MAHVDDPLTQRANLAYIRRSMKAPMLARERELDLARAWRENGDEAALNQLILSYTRLVIAIATRFRNYGLPLGDLVQEGNIGLLQAASRFEPERDVRFSTYASWWIRSAIQDFVLRNWSIVRTGTTAAQKSLFFNLRRLRARIEDPSSTRLSSESRAFIARTLAVPETEVESMEIRLSGADRSLNAQIGENSEEDWQDVLADTRPGPEEVVLGMRDAAARSRWLNVALGELDPRERRIINERRLSETAATLEELGRELGVSKERVRQLEARAMTKLKASMTRLAADPLLAPAPRSGSMPESGPAL